MVIVAPTGMEGNDDIHTKSSPAKLQKESANSAIISIPPGGIVDSEVITEGSPENTEGKETGPRVGEDATPDIEPTAGQLGKSPNLAEVKTASVLPNDPIQLLGNTLQSADSGLCLVESSEQAAQSGNVATLDHQVQGMVDSSMAPLSGSSILMTNELDDQAISPATPVVPPSSPGPTKDVHLLPANDVKQVQLECHHVADGPVQIQATKTSLSKGKRNAEALIGQEKRQRTIPPGTVLVHQQSPQLLGPPPLSTKAPVHPKIQTPSAQHHLVQQNLGRGSAALRSRSVGTPQTYQTSQAKSALFHGSVLEGPKSLAGMPSLGATAGSGQGFHSFALGTQHQQQLVAGQPGKSQVVMGQRPFATGSNHLSSQTLSQGGQQVRASAVPTGEAGQRQLAQSKVTGTRQMQHQQTQPLRGGVQQQNSSHQRVILQQQQGIQPVLVHATQRMAAPGARQQQQQLGSPQRPSHATPGRIGPVQVRHVVGQSSKSLPNSPLIRPTTPGMSPILPRPPPNQPTYMSLSAGNVQLPSGSYTSQQTHPIQGYALPSPAPVPNQETLYAPQQAQFSLHQNHFLAQPPGYIMQPQVYQGVLPSGQGGGQYLPRSHGVGGLLHAGTNISGSLKAPGRAPTPSQLVQCGMRQQVQTSAVSGASQMERSIMLDVCDRTVRVSSDTDAVSLYSLCRQWLRSDKPGHENVARWYPLSGGIQLHRRFPGQDEGNVALPKPIAIEDVDLREAEGVAADTGDSQISNGRHEQEVLHNDEKVSLLTSSELLQLYMERFRRVRQKAREERNRKVARYKHRLELLLPSSGAVQDGGMSIESG